MPFLLEFFEPVHPHACGEYYDDMDEIYGLYGPSPRVWGIQTSEPVNISAIRSIPTRVGNTLTDDNGNALDAVHPHACGEYPVVQLIVQSDSGPSPRVWGIRLDLFNGKPGTRSIPTRVGNTQNTF